MNSENSKTSNTHKLRSNLTHKTDLRRSVNCVALDLSMYYTQKNKKNCTETTNSRYENKMG